MTVHAYGSERDLAESMPLRKDSATVTEVEALDRDRRAEIRARFEALAEQHGLPDPTDDGRPQRWRALLEAAAEVGPDLVGQVAALHERYDRDHPALVRIRFETDDDFDFVAGQFVTVRFRGRSRPYSLARSPSSGELEICVRRVPGGRLSPTLCDDLAPGDRLTVRGPNGHLHLENRSGRDLAFFATGTGVAPLKAMLDVLFESGRDVFEGAERDVWLFLGAAWADDLPYHAEFAERARERSNFHYVPCVSREHWLSAWDGESEYVQDALLKYVDESALDDAAFGRHMARYLRQSPDRATSALLDPHELEVYACGLNGMVFGLETTVKRLGVPARHVHGEGYG